VKIDFSGAGGCINEGFFTDLPAPRLRQAGAHLFPIFSASLKALPAENNTIIRGIKIKNLYSVKMP
jgi:hypothetical protein